MKLALLISFLTLLSCNKQFDKTIIQNEIMKEFRASEQGWNNGDIDTYMNVYHKADSLRFVGIKRANYGWQTVRNNYKAKYNTKEKMGHLTFSEIDVKCSI